MCRYNLKTLKNFDIGEIYVFWIFTLTY